MAISIASKTFGQPVTVADPIEQTQRTHVMVTWRSNGGLQTCGPMTVAEGQTLVLQQLRPEGYTDAAARMLTEAEAITLHVKHHAEKRRADRERRKAERAAS